MPGNHLFGSGCKNSRSLPGWISLNAAGFVSFEATALMSLLVAMPSLTVIFSF